MVPPQTDLRYVDATLASQFFLGLFTRIGIREMRVKILVENLRRLLAEIPPLASVSPTEKRDKKGLEILRKTFVLQAGPRKGGGSNSNQAQDSVLWINRQHSTYLQSWNLSSKSRLKLSGKT